ncbi:MAG: hypothetical protein H7245_07730, partial [Candidatus Saccharibacteria bacterium]|nr:hypothetical protein [Pseudorhodobacter sp.]
TTGDTTTGDATTGDTAIADGTAVLPSPAVPDATASGALPSIEDEALADGQDPAAVDEVIPDAAVPVVAETAATVPTADVVPQPEPAPATLVTTEAAAVSTAGDDPQDEIFLASADAPPQTSDPLSLPQIASNTDAAPDAATPPPPFGTQYTFDAEGRIQPTPEGIMTPEGVFLIAGAPKIVPPTRPAPPAATAPATAIAAAPANGSTASPLANSIAEPLPAETFAYDPALAGKRPKLRPQGFVGPESTTAKQGEVLAPDANSRFASVRPQSRPSAMTSPATEVAVAEVSNDAAGASLALNGVQPSALAVSVSKKPAARPSGMNQAVNAAVAAALRTPEPEQQVAAAAPEAQAEPEVETAAPAMPSNASVAKQATTKDAINLSRVALLGIFGTASGRYAMIRQPAGGVKKVKVGDSIDGGRIAAISATAVQYQKGGRMLTLALPI